MTRRVRETALGMCRHISFARLEEANRAEATNVGAMELFDCDAGDHSLALYRIE